MGNALVVEDDWGLKAVVCRKVQKGKGRSGVLKKTKQPGSRTDQGGIVWAVVRKPLPPDPLYSHYVRKRHFSHCLRLALITILMYGYVSSIAILHLPDVNFQLVRPPKPIFADVGASQDRGPGVIKQRMVCSGG